MATPAKTPDSKSGYPEKQPRDKRDAHKPGPKRPPNPDEGGMDRDSAEDGSNDGD